MFKTIQHFENVNIGKPGLPQCRGQVVDVILRIVTSRVIMFCYFLHNWLWIEPWIKSVSNNYTLRPRQNGHYFPDNIFKYIFLNENIWIAIKISLKFVPKGPSNKILALVQIMAWHRPGNKPLSEPMMVRLSMHICFTLPQWVNYIIITF